MRRLLFPLFLASLLSPWGGCSCGGAEEQAIISPARPSALQPPPPANTAPSPSAEASAKDAGITEESDAGALASPGQGQEEKKSPAISSGEAFAAMFLSDAEKNDPAVSHCKEIKEQNKSIHCMLEQLLKNDLSAAQKAQELFTRSGYVLGLLPEQWMDGGYRGKLHLVPEAPVNGQRKHLEWVASSAYDFDRFFEGLSARAKQPIRYRHRPLMLRYFRSVSARTPSAFAYEWTVAYNLAGSLHRTADAVRETMFHEIFHLNDKDHEYWSARALASLYDGIAARCGIKIPCLRPYAPSETIIRGGTYYAFHPDNGVTEYAAELALRFYREQRAFLLKKPLDKKAFKCGPPENAKAWELLRDEFFGGVDLVPPC